jgi:putative membrane protein insertion efficiency factor
MKIIIFYCIKKYQKHAPKRIRNSCRYEPSCSNYMYLAIEKHGTIKGLWMGINRLLRCKIPNGGIDFP